MELFIEREQQEEFVREDSVLIVYAEDPRITGEHRLSRRLTWKYGKRFRVSRRRNVYVIYVDRQAVEEYRNRIKMLHQQQQHVPGSDDGDLVSGYYYYFSLPGGEPTDCNNNRRRRMTMEASSTS